MWKSSKEAKYKYFPIPNDPSTWETVDGDIINPSNDQDSTVLPALPIPQHPTQHQHQQAHQLQLQPQPPPRPPLATAAPVPNRTPRHATPPKARKEHKPPDGLKGLGLEILPPDPNRRFPPTAVAETAPHQPLFPPPSTFAPKQ